MEDSEWNGAQDISLKKKIRKKKNSESQKGM